MCLTDHCGECDVAAQPTALGECLSAQHGQSCSSSEAEHIAALMLDPYLMKEMPCHSVLSLRCMSRMSAPWQGCFTALCREYLMELWVVWVGHQPPLEVSTSPCFAPTTLCLGRCMLSSLSIACVTMAHVILGIGVALWSKHCAGTEPGNDFCPWNLAALQGMN